MFFCIKVAETWIECGVCAEVCPVGSIDPENSATIDQTKCIQCCACLKYCPEQAMTKMLKPITKKETGNFLLEPIC